MIGASSEDIKLNGTITGQGLNELFYKLYPSLYHFRKLLFYIIQSVRKHNFESIKMIASDLNNDRALFKQISAGDEKAFRAIYDLYRIELFKVVIRLTKSQVIAEEIIQEVFISLWISREHLIKVEEPASYIYRIVFNKTGSYLKKEANQEQIIKAAMQNKQSSSNSTDQVIDANESQRLIEQALEQLPPQQKIVYKLSRQQGLSNDEIARQLNISQHTVKSHLSKAIGFIRTYLEDIAIAVVLWATISDFNFF